MARCLAAVICLLAVLAPAAAQACTDSANLHRGTTIDVGGASAVRVDLRERGRGHLLALRANDLALAEVGRRMVVLAGKRRILSVPVRTRGVRHALLILDAQRVRLQVGGRQASASRKLVAETALRVGKRVLSGSIRWTRACPPAAPAAGCSTCGAPAAGAPPSATPAVADITAPFAATSVWNAPLAANAALDAHSSAYVAELRRQLATTNPWINTTTYSAPVYTVPAGQPTVRVKLDTTAPALQAAFEQVPIPAGAQPAAGSDHHLVIWQPATDTMWEFWLTAKQADGWHARWGGRMTGASLNPGYFTAPNQTWGATATSLPLMGGLIRIDELRQGHIDHALAFAIPHTRKGVWAWPAQRTDGDVDSADAIPEGARFRLDPALDIDALKLPPVTAMIAKAVQRYGMVLRDKSGAISFYAEDPAQYGTNPYPALFGTWPNRLFDRFPWDRLQVLALDLHS